MDLWEKCVDFHGHRCGGLRIGYAAALYAMELLGIRFSDNERALKGAFLLNVVLFAVFNVVIWNFVGVLSNTVVFISLIV